MSGVSSEQAYAEGQAAQKAGMMAEDCPYDVGTLEAEMWASGFEDADSGIDALDLHRKIQDADRT